MDDDLLNGTPEESAGDDLRATLIDAVKEHGGDAPEGADAPAAAVAETPAPTGDRARGPDGKFVPKSADAATPAAQQAAPTAAGNEPPAHWPEVDRTAFKTLPLEAQSFLMTRHRAMEADYTQKTQAIAEFKRDFEPVSGFFAPHRQMLAQQGLTPAGLIKAWGDAAQGLADPARKEQTMLHLCRAYGVDPGRLLGAAAQPSQQPVQDPRFDSLQRDLGAMREFVAQSQRQQQAAQVSGIQQQILDPIKNEKDAVGQPVRPHWDVLEQTMATIAEGQMRAGQSVDPKQLYEAAIMLNPHLRNEFVASQRSSAEASRLSADKTRASRARIAGSSVTGAPGPGQAASNGSGSIRDDIARAMQQHA